MQRPPTRSPSLRFAFTQAGKVLPAASLRALGLREHACKAWLVDLDATPSRLLDWLTAADKARFARIRDRQERVRRHIAYAALRMLLARYAGHRYRSVAVLRTAKGAPRLAGAPAIFSLSHSGRYALIAFAPRGQLGVDLEMDRTIDMPPLRRAQIAAAADTLGPTPLDAGKDLDVLQAWTRLEARAKATGDGIGRTLTELGVRARRAPATQKDAPAHAAPASAPTRGLAIHDLWLPPGLRGAIARGI